MGFVTARGTAEPFQDHPEPYTAFGNRIPALRNFALWFEGAPAPDKEIVLLGVMAGGHSEDLSPDADLNPANIPDGALEVDIQDAEPNTERFSYGVSHSTLRVPGARRYQLRDVGCVGDCVRGVPSTVIDPTPGRRLLALVGFRLFFTGNREHEIDRIGVWFDQQQSELHVEMRDQSVGTDEVFGYLVDFVAIPVTPDLNVTTGTVRGSATGSERVPHAVPRRTDFMLTGWRFDYSSGDHEINALGVDRRPDLGDDEYQVLFSDKNADDPFTWRVDWAHVGPRVFAPV